MTTAAVGGELEEAAARTPVLGIFALEEDAIDRHVIRLAGEAAVSHVGEGQAPLECVLGHVDADLRVGAGVLLAGRVLVNHDANRFD
jgi:hypothetical protein